MAIGAFVIALTAIGGLPRAPLPDALATLLALSLALMLWRLAMRFGFVTAAYGWREGLWSLPRAVLANIIAMMAARRAVLIYLRSRRDGVIRWEKTAHVFPAAVPAE
jgi:bacteriophage N4 adsorption protein B